MYDWFGYLLGGAGEEGGSKITFLERSLEHEVLEGREPVHLFTSLFPAPSISPDVQQTFTVCWRKDRHGIEQPVATSNYFEGTNLSMNTHCMPGTASFFHSIYTFSWVSSYHLPSTLLDTVDSNKKRSSSCPQRAYSLGNIDLQAMVMQYIMITSCISELRHT